MKRNNFFSRFIVVTLIAALLLVSGSRAIRVSALADSQIIPELAPVFDTQIIAIEDYIENNVTPPQFEVFNILLGLYVAGQGGFAEYKLHDPFANSSDILDWLKSCGIRLYNHLVGMGAIGPDPITGIDYRPYIKGAADIAMGCAVKATQYTDVNDFVSDVNVQEKYFIPMDFGVQGALNYIFSKNGGLYNWQFSEGEFVCTRNYNTIVLPPTSNYWTLLASFTEPIVRAYQNVGTDLYNPVSNSNFFETYTNLFLNTSNGYFYFVDDSGNLYESGSNISVRTLYVYSNTGYVINETGYLSLRSYPTLDTYQDIVQYIIDHNYEYWHFSNFNYNFADFVKHYYYGSSWDNKIEIHTTMDLNLDANSLPYYQQIANDYLLDVKGILADLLNETDLTNVILNNIYDLDAVKVEDPKLIRVTTEILEEIQVLNPPLPVNMNDIELYTDNTYLERVKEHARNAGDVFANYVAFWHNVDSDLVYTIFGAGILVLVAAFIGKWGHS